MEPKRLNSIDNHLKRYIFTQIFVIIAGVAILYRGIPLIARGWTAGETYLLPLGIAYVVCGMTPIVVGMVLVNSAINRLQSRISSDSETK